MARVPSAQFRAFSPLVRSGEIMAAVLLAAAVVFNLPGVVRGDGRCLREEVVGWLLVIGTLTAYFRGYRVLQRAERRERDAERNARSSVSATAVVIGWAIVFCLLSLLIPPFLSMDVYYYGNAGWQQAAYHVNPYVSCVSDLPNWKSDRMFYPEWVNVLSPYGFLFSEICCGFAWLGGGSAERTALLFKLLNAAAFGATVKAADAETIGGLPPHPAFCVSGAFHKYDKRAGSYIHSATAQPLATGTTPVTTAGGTINKLAKFDANADITSSIIFDNGTSVGVGNSAPAAKLDVSGTSIFRGLLTLPALSAATASAGKNSQPMNFTASSFNSSTKKAVNESFRWQAEAVGNDSTAPSGQFGTAVRVRIGDPSRNRALDLKPEGLITFAAGQTFPSGSGSVTSVGLTAPTSDFTVSGSPVTTSGTLNFAWNVAPTNAATANAIVSATPPAVSRQARSWPASE